MQGSTAETSKQNIFIHEFIQPKHASNPWELTTQNGSQAGERECSVQRQKEPGFAACRPVTVRRIRELPGLTVSRPAREASFLKGPGPSTILFLTWTPGQEEEGPFCSGAGCNFILKMSPNLMQQQKAGATNGATNGSGYAFCLSRALVSSRKAFRCPVTLEKGEGSNKDSVKLCSAPAGHRRSSASLPLPRGWLCVQRGRLGPLWASGAAQGLLWQGRPGSLPHRRE